MKIIYYCDKFFGSGELVQQYDEMIERNKSMLRLNSLHDRNH